MYKNKKIIAIIPARGNSERIPKKNLKILGGKPLIVHTFEQAKSSKFIDDIYVSTEDQDIKNISLSHNIKVINRPVELAAHTSKMHPVIQHAISTLEETPDIIVLLQPTSPFRKTITIDKAITSFLDADEEYDSLMPLIKLKLKKGKINSGDYIPVLKEDVRSQDLEHEYAECGTIFIFKLPLIESGTIIGKKILPFIIEDKIESLDVDDQEEFYIAESLMKNKTSPEEYKSF